MAASNFSRPRYALRLVASVFILSSPCGCQRQFEPLEVGEAASAPDPTPVRNPAAPVAPAIPTTPPAATLPTDPLPPASPGEDLPGATTAASRTDATATGPDAPVLRAVRTGAHPGFDRLVFEFDGVGLPAWDIEYVDRPVRDCGTGAPVPVAGDAWLQVRFHGAAAHTPEGVATGGPARREVALPNLRELVRLCDFEAEVTWVGGVVKPTAYTPRALEAPARLVVDVAH